MKISMHSSGVSGNSIKWFNMCCCGGSNQFACIDSSTLHCGIDKKQRQRTTATTIYTIIAITTTAAATITDEKKIRYDGGEKWNGNLAQFTSAFCFQRDPSVNFTIRNSFTYHRCDRCSRIRVNVQYRHVHMHSVSQSVSHSVHTYWCHITICIITIPHWMCMRAPCIQ